MRNLMVWSALLIFLAGGCVSVEQPVVGQGSSLSSVTGKMADAIKTKYDITGRNIQVSPNSFWERDTRINLPFSSVLCDAMSTELSRLEAKITVQETGEKPLTLIGSYQLAKTDVLVTMKLRAMGETASTDLAVVQERISRAHMDPKWLEPDFGRMARTLIRLLEADYSGMGSLKIKTSEFKPAETSRPDLVLGKEFEKYVKDALAQSAVFRVSGEDMTRDGVELKGDYVDFGNRIVFHAAIVDQQTGKTHAGASFEVAKNTIPENLLTPKIKRLDELAEKIANTMIEGYVNKPGVKKDPSLVFISKKSFPHAGLKAVVPVSFRLAEKFKDIFSQHSQFIVTGTPTAKAALILSGSVYMEENALVVSASFDQIVSTPGGTGLETIAVDQGQLNRIFCQDHWFEVDLNGKTDYLMQRLEKKSIAFVKSDLRPEILINSFRLQNSKHYTLFSDYLSGYILDYFAGSRYFSPVKNVAARLAKVRTASTRTIVDTEKTEAAVAELAKAPYYMEGSFWPDRNGDVEIKAIISSTKGRILASDHIKIQGLGIDPKWFELPEDDRFSDNMNALSTNDSRLGVTLLTQKGRNNLSFQKGEEILFMARASKDVYLKLFTAGVDKKIYRIYPNQFSSGETLIRAGEVTSIPGSHYSDDFRFQVQGKTGNELVFAFASDTPLPDLPQSKKTDFFGMTRVYMGVKEIKAWFSDYALERGISLSWDSLPIRTVD